ncbi:MAG TPA: HAD family phosphatase [Bacteroidales bacterium]|nr:HAD family phosphatase [Bacteroidales bacterium]
MTKKIKAVIWDMGGVILRTSGEDSRLEMAKEFQVPADTLYKLVFDSPSAEKATVGLISESDHWNFVADNLGVSRDRVQELQDRFWAGDTIDKQLVEFIKSLNKSYKTGLLSNAWSGARQSLDQRIPIGIVFQYSMFSCEVRLRKPDAKIYHRMLELMEVKADEAIFVDDFSENIAGANAVGIHGVQFFSTAQAIADVNQILSSLND